MPENPSEHTNDEKQLPKTSSEFGGGNWFPPSLVTAPESWDDGDWDDDDFRKAYLEYVAACEECNRRLRPIAALLKRGLHTEAIQLTELEPHLLELVVELNFPSLKEWCEVLRKTGLTQPPELELDIAQQINAVIGNSQSHQLSRLERRHRLLPLAGAPLQQRINTLRRLHQLQNENTTWIRQLELLEKARHREFPNELKAAVAANDLELFNQICEQVESPEWRVPPEAGTVNLVRKLKQDLADQGTPKMKKNWVLIPLLLIVILLVIPWMLGGWSVSNGWSEIVDKSQDKPEVPMALISLLFYLWWQDTNRRKSKQD